MYLGAVSREVRANMQPVRWVMAFTVDNEPLLDGRHPDGCNLVVFMRCLPFNPFYT